jgi:ATP:corrinoid adenosyltransferase
MSDFCIVDDATAAWKAANRHAADVATAKKFAVSADTISRHVCTLTIVDEMNAVHAREGFMDVQPMGQLQALQRALQQSIVASRLKKDHVDSDDKDTLHSDVDL